MAISVMMKLTFISDIRDVISDVYADEDPELASSRRAVLRNDYLIQLATSLTTGTFFTVLMLAMGADDVYLGYVAMVTTLCSFVQILAPFFWERLQIRKPFLITAIALYNFLYYGVIAVIPILPMDNRLKLIAYMVVTLLSGVLNNFIQPAFNAWTMQSIPFVKRLNFTSVSSLVKTVIGIISVFLAGVLLDTFEDQELSFGSFPPALSAILILRTVVFLLMTVSTILQAVKIKEYPYEEGAKLGSFALLIEPLKNKAFLLSILIPTLNTFIGCIIGNFFNLHLVENVQMSYTMISSASMISTPVLILFTPIWTMILKRHSWIRTLGFALMGYACAYVCNVFISKETQYFYFICIILGNLFQPCITMVSNNLVYLHLPEANRTAFFSFSTLASGVASFLGQTVGTLFVKNTTGLELNWFGVSVCNLQLTSAIAAVALVGLSFYALWYASREEQQKNRAGDGSQS